MIGSQFTQIIEKATANQEMTNEKITEMNQKFEGLLKAERLGKWKQMARRHQLCYFS